MRLYAESSLEALRARRFLKQWRDDGLLSAEHYGRLEEETATDLRTTNVFLRIVLLIFTLIAVASAVGLFFVLAGHKSGSTAGTSFLVFGVLSYVAAEIAASQAGLYRYGIEEAFGICAVALVCLGLDSIFFGNGVHSVDSEVLLVAIVGALTSIWLWHRFGLPYAFVAAMIFTIFLPAYWTPSHATQRCLICVSYAAALACVVAVRSRHRSDYLAQGYSLVEAFLWVGIYLVLNLKLSVISTPSEWWTTTRTASEFAAPFYWTTWVLLWFLPPIILVRGVRQKDRFLIAVGMITAVLTLVTNKPYLGWQRHTWDPMLLGVALIAVAVFVQRWLARGQGGVRHGFTAASMSGKHKHTLSVASSVFGLLSPHTAAPPAQPRSAEFESGFGGGSGGGGASGDF